MSGAGARTMTMRHATATSDATHAHERRDVSVAAPRVLPEVSARYRIGAPSMIGILWTIAVILFVFWILGLLFHIGGALINIILVVVIVIAIYNFITGRKAA